MVLARHVMAERTDLRSGFCRSLMSDMARIEENESNPCPSCGEENHDTQHHFKCHENPAEFTHDLWENPIGVSKLFLNLPDGGELQTPAKRLINQLKRKFDTTTRKIAHIILGGRTQDLNPQISRIFLCFFSPFR